MSISFIMRTHLWNDVSKANFKYVSDLTKSTGANYVGFDITNFAEIDLIKAEYPILTHSKNDFINIGLPTHPLDKLLWWYGDYVIYKFFSQVDTEYICIYEYDLFMSSDLLKAWQHIKYNKIDASTCFIWEAEDSWYWKNHSEKKYKSLNNTLTHIEKIYATNFPFLIINRKAANYLLQRRLLQTAGDLTEGVYCEPFLATELKSAGFSLIGLNTIGINTSKISTTIPICFNEETIFDQFKHPVLADSQFLPKAIACLKSIKEKNPENFGTIYSRITETITSPKLLNTVMKELANEKK